MDSIESLDQGTVLSDRLQSKMQEVAALVLREHFGAEGPPKDMTFREIEELGFRVAQLAAREVQEAATEQHQAHYHDPQDCPQCGRKCQPKDPVERKLLTRLGPVRIAEIEFHCDACRRSFFPSTSNSTT